MGNVTGATAPGEPESARPGQRQPTADESRERDVSAVSVWPAPAKLNLFLHVTGRRADGFHDLQTLFQIIDLCDTVTITVREDGVIERPNDPSGVDEDSDLTVRAARALQSMTGTRLGATLGILKRIPMGGGLGGGSSDAATTLLALNHLWKCGLSIVELSALGLTLGSDVPVFIQGFSAWAEGRGERLTAIELRERWYVIVHPGVHVSTASVFQTPELTRNSPLITIRAFFESGGRNDCEPVVRSRFPEVADALDWLARFEPARLTGTGACVFAACASASEAERIAARVPDRWRSFVARGLNTSPLHERLGTLARATN
jgi:4-diphosphocytidyl-2-C-methyl-D-erythritol kinase